MKNKKNIVQSNPISRWLRPHLEKTKLLVAMILTSNILISSMAVVISPTHAFDYIGSQEQVAIGGSEITQVVTTSAYMFPVAESLGISQHYHALHRGIDIRAPKGSEIVAVSEGVVIEVREQSFGYGKHVRIAHAGTVSSLYAHLDEIQVEVGQKVAKGEVIGTVGSTGWSTGYHLHLEIYESQNTINPEEIL